MKKIICVLVVICCFIIGDRGIVYAKEEPTELYAQSAVLMDGETGRVLFGKNDADEKANASTTKILTCIIALEEGDLEQVVSVSQRAQNQPAVHLGVVEGEKYILEDMLYALMLESFNDSAVIIAEGIAGSVEAFQVMMNEKAMSIGCKNTYFITPNGLDAEDEYGKHHTTAEDLALIMKYCISDSALKKEFLQITQTLSYSFANYKGNRQFTCNNHNSLLQIREDAISGKTGFTNDAGYCYVGAIENQGRVFIIALLGCGWPNNREYKWNDAKKLLDYGIENYFYQDVLYEKGEAEIMKYNIIIPNGKTWEDVCYAKMKLSPIKARKILLNSEETISYEVSLPQYMYAPIQEGELVGYIRYKIDNYLLDIRGVYTVNIIKKENIRYKIYKKFIKTILN